jgi:hypothetical protein
VAGIGGATVTRDEIMKMEAGRRLDALIAEKVMGWKSVKIEQYTDWTTKFLNVTGVKPSFEAPFPIHVRFYSTDVAAAWEVVDRVESMADYWHTNINHRPASSKFSKYHEGEEAFEYSYVNFVFVETDGGRTRFRGGEYHGNCPIPLAICRAALLAVLEAK